MCISCRWHVDISQVNLRTSEPPNHGQVNPWPSSCGSAHVDRGSGGQKPDFLVDVINGWPLSTDFSNENSTPPKLHIQLQSNFNLFNLSDFIVDHAISIFQSLWPDQFLSQAGFLKCSKAKIDMRCCGQHTFKIMFNITQWLQVIILKKQKLNTICHCLYWNHQHHFELLFWALNARNWMKNNLTCTSERNQ